MPSYVNQLINFAWRGNQNDKLVSLFFSFLCPLLISIQHKKSFGKLNSNSV